MRFLLDTHAVLFSIGDRSRLSKRSLTAFGDPKSEFYYSPVSLWEIAILMSRKRIQFGSSVEELEDKFEKTVLATKLPILTKHLDLIRTLEFHHNDPFDRLLAAQAVYENLILISSDKIFDKYGVERVW